LPVASTPYWGHSAGMNCIQPSAPAVETARSVPKLVSILLIAASTFQGIP
jgi:hypothetical protein